jgi:cystathionine beta-lyase/cystathionine gamma-synthase
MKRRRSMSVTHVQAMRKGLPLNPPHFSFVEVVIEGYGALLSFVIAKTEAYRALLSFVKVET